MEQFDRKVLGAIKTGLAEILPEGFEIEVAGNNSRIIVEKGVDTIVSIQTEDSERVMVVPGPKDEVNRAKYIPLDVDKIIARVREIL